jgi:hypothetical protein
MFERDADKFPEIWNSRELARLHRAKSEVLSLILQIKAARPGGSITIKLSLPTRIDGAPIPVYKVPTEFQEYFFSALLPILEQELASIESDLAKQNGAE